ncbi:uncharacterized protein LOC123007969 isoform X2 [Tribolium madens]|uniref:uncharacterized protein LOC123007969 isoform X2 n=1 Tax=Tribolium madens TaxID=41895 RepID=UPI001CF74A16|nr:uncharacterized protein LOC123007969 isoform X2 [Tribolium madens]
MDKIDDTLAQLHLSPNKMGPTPICLPCPNSLPKNDLREYLEIFKKHILYGEKIEIVAVNSAFTTGEGIKHPKSLTEESDFYLSWARI